MLFFNNKMLLLRLWLMILHLCRQNGSNLLWILCSTVKLKRHTGPQARTTFTNIFVLIWLVWVREEGFWHFYHLLVFIICSLFVHTTPVEPVMYMQFAFLQVKSFNMRSFTKLRFLTETNLMQNLYSVHRIIIIIIIMTCQSYWHI